MAPIRQALGRNIRPGASLDHRAPVQDRTCAWRENAPHPQSRLLRTRPATRRDRDAITPNPRITITLSSASLRSAAASARSSNPVVAVGDSGSRSAAAPIRSVLLQVRTVARQSHWVRILAGHDHVGRTVVEQQAWRSSGRVCEMAARVRCLPAPLRGDWLDYGFVALLRVR